MAEQALLGAKRCKKITNVLSPDEYYSTFLKNRLDIIYRTPQRFSLPFLEVEKITSEYTNPNN